ncbi:MAG: TonB-dependent receptor [Bacteroidota bacterium]
MIFYVINRFRLHKLFVVLIVLMLLGYQMRAQNDISISGTVTDQSDNALPGVNVVLVGTSYGVATDQNGTFNFVVSEERDYILRASSVGFITYEQQVQVTSNEQVRLRIRLQDNTESLDQVEITGKSVSDEIRASPLNVSLIDIEPLQNRNLDLQQAFNRVAGVRVREEGGLGSGFNLSINGIGGRGVRYFIDGVPLENFGRSLQLNNLPINVVERAEIYKGMIPVDLGADALGGAINIVTRQYETNYLDASYSYASFNTHRSAVNARHTQDRSGLTLGLSAYYNRSDNDYRVEGPGVFIVEQGQRQAIEARRFHDGYRAYLGQAEIGFLNRPWADRLLLSFAYSGLDSEVQTGVTMEQVYGNVEEGETNQMLALRYDKEYATGLSLNVYGVYNTLHQSITDSAARNYSWDGSFIPSPAPLGGEIFSQYKTLSEFTNRTFLGRANVTYSLNDHQKLVLNTLSSTTRRTGQDPLRFPPGTEDIYQAPATLSKAVTGLSYRLQLWEDKLETDFSLKHFYYASLAIPPYGLLEDQQDYEDHDYGLGGAIKYNIKPGWAARVSFERTLRLPAEDELFGDGLFVRPNPDLVPETSQNLNLGMQYQREINQEHYLSANLNGFYRNIQNQILQTQFDIRWTINRNVREVRGLGLEFELQYRYKDWLTLSNATTYQDLRDNKQFEDDNSGVVRTNYRAILPNTPRFFSFSEVSFSKQDLFKPGNTFSVYYNLNFVQEFFLTWARAGAEREEFKNTIPTQWNHSAGINYTLAEGRYNLSLEASNFTDNLLYDNFALLKPRRAYSAKLRYFLNK